MFWLRGLDLNQGPSGYEPDELPDCSTPRYFNCDISTIVLNSRLTSKIYFIYIIYAFI